MSWSGGTYRKGNYGTNGWTGDASLGIGIEAGRHDTQDDDFATGINQCLNKDGSNAATGNLNIGSNRVTNVATGTARTDAATVAQVQDRTSSYLGTTGGTSTAFTVTATPTITALTTGAQYVFKANAANGAAATLKIDGTAATTMQRQGTALAGNEFKANDFITVVYDGTNFQITNIATAPLFVDRTNNRVGVGTTTPGADVDVQGTGTQLLETRFSADTTGAQLYLRKSRSGTVGTNTIVTTGDQLGGIYFSGANGTGYDAAAAISGYAETEPGASGDMPGSIRFFTCANSSATLTERMRIDSSGRVGIGVQSPFSNLNVNAAIQIGGSVTATENFHLTGGTAQVGLSIWKGNYGAGTYLAQFHSNGQLNINTTSNIGGLLNLQLGTSGGVNDVAIATQNATNGNYAAIFKNVAGTQVGRIQVDASATQYVTSSDYRLKNNITPMIHGLDKVMALKPCKWTWKDYGDEGQGFIAHELQEVIPQAVSGKKDAVDANGDPVYQGVDTGFIVATLTNAIQELNTKVDALEARVAALEA